MVIASRSRLEAASEGPKYLTTADAGRQIQNSAMLCQSRPELGRWYPLPRSQFSSWPSITSLGHMRVAEGLACRKFYDLDSNTAQPLGSLHYQSRSTLDFCISCLTDSSYSKPAELKVELLATCQSLHVSQFTQTTQHHMASAVCSTLEQHNNLEHADTVCCIRSNLLLLLLVSACSHQAELRVTGAPFLPCLQCGQSTCYVFSWISKVVHSQPQKLLKPDHKLDGADGTSSCNSMGALRDISQDTAADPTGACHDLLEVGGNVSCIAECNLPRWS